MKITYASPQKPVQASKLKKQFKEDEIKNQNDQEGEQKGKFGVKAIRKILRTLCDEYQKDEMNLMIWVRKEKLLINLLLGSG